MSESSITDILFFSKIVVEYSNSFPKVSTYFSLHLIKFLVKKSISGI